jgi:hypothetical protein
MRDITSLEMKMVQSLHIWSMVGIGIGYKEFGIEFGKLLKLDFEPRWYGMA